MRCWRLIPGSNADSQNTRVARQVPDIRLGPGELGAVDPRLLAGPDTDHLAVQGIADRVRLGVFQGYQGEQQIPFRGCVEFAADDVVEIPGFKPAVVSLLRQGGAEHLPRFDRRRAVVRIGLDDHEGTALLGGQRGQYAFLEPGCHDSVADDALEIGGGGHVDRLGKRHEVAERGLGVRAPGPHVGRGKRRQVAVANLVHLPEVGGQWHADGGTRGRDVLEGRRRGRVEGLAEFGHELPSVQRIEHVDHRRGTASDAHGVRLECRLRLMRIAAVFECRHL